jgi:signal transduction histidine kinase
MTTSIAPAAPALPTRAPAATATTATSTSTGNEPFGLDDRLRVFGDASRWATVVLGILVGLVTGPLDVRFATVAAALLLHAALQHADPMTLVAPTDRERLRVALELILTLLGVAATGVSDSPFVLTPMTGLVLAGYVYGERFMTGTLVSVGVATAGVVAIQVTSGAPGTAAELGLVFLLCGMLGTFGRSFLVAVEAHRVAVLDQASRMATANDLLVALHGIAQTLPASLDLGEVVASARARLRTLVPFSVLVILVRDDTGGGWRVELAEGVRLGPSKTIEELPPLLRHALAAPRPIVVDDVLVTGDKTCEPLSRSALYAPLRARGGVVGLLALEHADAHVYGPPEVELVANLSGLVALSIDNATWFNRLRMFGAEAERARIARDLHDRIAQSLAYVAFELERLRDGGGEMQPEIASLHDVVRGVVTELRETLYMLRASITEDADLVVAATEFLTRFEERTGTHVHWQHRVEARLPVPLEQEVWRILQEACTNVERHAGATNLWVTWVALGRHARLEVRDDGCGFDPARVAGDHYGLVGIRERADAIRGRVAVTSAPGRGTILTLDVETQA